MAEDHPRGTEIIGKTIVSEEHGKKYGNVEDVSFVADTGELMNILVSQTTDHLNEEQLQKDSQGRTIVPFSAVKSIGDFVIVSEGL
ncbi:MAG: PRC-barrel domain-containing protein [Candidatus Nanosalina sp.]